MVEQVEAQLQERTQDVVCQGVEEMVPNTPKKKQVF
jgi:hypothetical protein